MKVSLWADEIKPTTSKVIAKYSKGWLNGQAAITINKYKNGNVYYIGTSIDRPYLDTFVQWLLPLVNVQTYEGVSEDLRILKRSCNDYELLFLLNFSHSPQTVHLEKSWINILSDEKNSIIQIPPLEVVVLKK